MRAMYQTEWQGIKFSDFSKLSSKELAGPGFYQAFYEEFFTRYHDWEQLPSSWRKVKKLWAKFVLDRCETGSCVLSVGCGLGQMEHYIYSQKQQIDLFINDAAPAALRWIGAELTKEKKLFGLIPDCLPDGIKFDLVYLATVDYALDDDALVGLLAAIRPFLTDVGGQCLLISASFQDTPITLKGKVSSLVNKTKVFAAQLLDSSGLRPRGQLWGWIRTQGEYQSLLRRAGYRDIEDGFINPDKRDYYWISGC